MVGLQGEWKLIKWCGYVSKEWGKDGGEVDDVGYRVFG